MSSNILQNGSCSPDVHQKNTLSGPTDGWKDGIVANERSRSVGKSTEAGDAALLYFEAMLGTLTRTKESIGRATRIAIDCAKMPEKSSGCSGSCNDFGAWVRENQILT
ncbi:hypothetical protein V8G54_021324 [Vigna mungo]|uniref:Uncharacterized protein n=1 Tax=Vigna mungo TaxID=3915 RepID=A0AAQ3NFX1_VIGMU